MIKKIVGFAIVATLLLTSPALAAPKSNQATKAAPALAVEILLKHEVTPTGDVLTLVSEQLGPNATFMGLEKDDPLYEHEVMHYLHHTLGVIDMDQENCEYTGMNQ